MEYDEKLAKYRKTVGTRLKSARKVARMTQEESAEHLGVLLKKEIPASRIGNYEQGTRLPDPVILQLLCQIYDGASAAVVAGFDDAIDSDEQELLQKYRLTDARGREAIHSIAETQAIYDVGLVDSEDKPSK